MDQNLVCSSAFGFLARECLSCGFLWVLDYNEIVVSESVAGWKGNEVVDKDFGGEGGYLHCCRCFGS